jgi:hypothetical protein
MAPHYTDSLEDAFPLLRQKRKLEEGMVEAQQAAEAEAAKAAAKEASHQLPRMVEYVKAEKVKPPKKRFMTMSDIPHEDMFGNVREPAEEDIDENTKEPPYSGVGRRLKDGRPFMHTAFYDGHALTLAVVGCAVAVLILGLRQMVAIASLHKYVQHLHDVVDRQHHEVMVKMQMQMQVHSPHHAAQYVMPRFA